MNHQKPAKAFQHGFGLWLFVAGFAWLLAWRAAHFSVTRSEEITSSQFGAI